MRTNIYTLFMLAFIAAFMVSCTQSNDPLEEMKQNPETRAGSPLLIATPTEVNYTDVEASLTNIVKQTVNIKTAGLSPLSALTAFDVKIQGVDSYYFLVDPPTQSCWSFESFVRRWSRFNCILLSEKRCGRT